MPEITNSMRDLLHMVFIIFFLGFLPHEAKERKKQPTFSALAELVGRYRGGWESRNRAGRPGETQREEKKAPLFSALLFPIPWFSL